MFTLKYDLASIFEEDQQEEKALPLYQEIYDWNPAFRDVSARMAALQPYPKP
jgi:hypothetical protein